MSDAKRKPPGPGGSAGGVGAVTGWPTLPLGVAGALLADDEMAALWSPEAEIDAILAFERALARAQCGAGVLKSDTLDAIEAVCTPDALDHGGLAEGLRRDGVIVPELVRQMRTAIDASHAADHGAGHGAGHAAGFHIGATSQDALDTALMLRLKAAVGVLRARLAEIAESLAAFSKAHGAHPVMARTRFQDALPFTLEGRVQTWTGPLRGLAASAPGDFPLQLGGPIGLREEAFGPRHGDIAAAMAGELGLSEPGRAWHTDRRAIGAVAHWCAEIAAALGKIGLDVALMAQSRVAEIRVPGGGSSSMPHKNNPVAAELLAALARHVCAHAATVQGAGLHENERSGIAWTLEWLALPPLLMGCGASTRAAAGLVAGLGPGSAAALA